MDRTCPGWLLCLEFMWTTSWWQLCQTGRRRRSILFEQPLNGEVHGKRTTSSSRDARSPSSLMVATCWTSSIMSRRSQQPRLRRKWWLWRETLLWCLSLGPVLDLYSGWLARRDLTSQLTCPSYRRAWMTWPATTSTRSTRSSAMSRWRQMQAFASSLWIHQIWFW